MKLNTFIASALFLSFIQATSSVAAVPQLSQKGKIQMEMMEGGLFKYDSYLIETPSGESTLEQVSTSQFNFYNEHHAPWGQVKKSIGSSRISLYGRKGKIAVLAKRDKKTSSGSTLVYLNSAGVEIAEGFVDKTSNGYFYRFMSISPQPIELMTLREVTSGSHSQFLLKVINESAVDERLILSRAAFDVLKSDRQRKFLVGATSAVAALTLGIAARKGAFGGTKTSTNPVSSIGSSALQKDPKVKTVLYESRKDLLSRFEKPLSDIITELRSDGNDQEDEETEDHLIKNKAKVFQKSLDEYQKKINSNPTFAQEEVGVFKLSAPVSSSDLLLASPRVNTSLTENWMDTSNALKTLPTDPNLSITMGVFANICLGGSCWGPGNVQEEQLVQRSTEFALIVAEYNKPHSRSKLLTRKNSNLAVKDSADPILITNVRFILNQSDEAARDHRAFSSDDYDADRAFQVVDDAPAINLIAMAAPQFSGAKEKGGQFYTELLATDLFENAISAFYLTKRNDVSKGQQTLIYSGLWGAGVFGHNADMSIAIQTIAARLVGVNQLVFTGIDKKHQKSTEKTIAIANELFEETATVAQSPEEFKKALIDHLLIKAKSLNWKTKR